MTFQATEADVLNELGVVYLWMAKPSEALPPLNRAMALQPRVARHHYNLGLALEQLSRDRDALAAFRRAVMLDPSNADAQEKVGNQLTNLGREAEATEAFRRAAAASPDSALGLMCGAKVLLADGRLVEAEASLRAAILREPSKGEAFRYLGAVLREQGRFDEAVEVLEQATDAQPGLATAYFDLTHSKRVTAEDELLVEQMQTLLTRDGITELYEAMLHFALGKAFDDLGDYARAIRHFDAGNQRSRGATVFDRAGFGAGVTRLIDTFDHAFFARHASLGASSEMPILIVGMPRSGTTLLEQIISRHNDVGAGGELRYWSERAGKFAQAGAAGLTSAFIDPAAADYLAELGRLAPGKARVVDKLPGNFLWLGLIHLALPNARILHSRRHRVDTCLSNYFTHFSGPMDYAYERGDLVYYYRQYERLMAHWRSVLPADRFLDVDYEALVADPEPTARAILGFCSLEWDEACLQPEANQRAVIKTASMWQARQPVYRTSVERWRRYEPWLGELRGLLPDAPPVEDDPRPRSANPVLPRLRKLAEAGCIGEAIPLAAAELRGPSPHDAVLYNELGTLYLRSRRAAEALDCFERAIALNVAFAAAHHNRGVALEVLGRIVEAAVAHRRAVEHDDALAHAHTSLGNLLAARDESEEAARHFRRAAELGPGTALGQLDRGKSLILEDDIAGAEACVRRALALDATLAEGHRVLGNMLTVSGRFAEAIECLRRAVAADPSHVVGYYDLVLASRLTEEDRDLIPAMQTLLDQGERTAFERSLLGFALGKAHADLGENETAMRFYDAANRMEKAKFFFDRAGLAATVDRIIEEQTPAYLARMAALGVADELPLLVLGMPRSGTTLVEQIVSSHPQVAAGGELPFWTDHAQALGAAAAESDPAPAVRRMADDYRAVLRRAGPQALRVTDKNPFNFLAIGLILTVFPRARIIHCRRDPIDTALSIYCLRFAGRMEFAYDRADIIFYYRQYQRLMAQWRTVLPAERFVEVDYETLVAEPEAETRRLIGFTGLPWDDACLAPECNERTIRTASLWQARQPVYATSVQRWRRFEPWLGELRELGEAPGLSAASPR